MELKKDMDALIADMWSEKEASDIIKNIDKTVGTYHLLGPVILYGESETRAANDYAVYMKNLLINDSISLKDCISALVNFWTLSADRWRRWYKWEVVPNGVDVHAKALQACANKEDAIYVINSFRQYVGKFNFRLDAYIPWLSISLVTEHRIRDLMK